MKNSPSNAPKRASTLAIVVGILIAIIPIVFFGLQMLHPNAKGYMIPGFAEPITSDIASAIIVACVLIGISIIAISRARSKGSEVVKMYTDEESDLIQMLIYWKKKKLTPEAYRKRYPNTPLKPYRPITTTWKQNAIELSRKLNKPLPDDFIKEYLMKKVA